MGADTFAVQKQTQYLILLRIDVESPIEAALVKGSDQAFSVVISVESIILGRD